MSVDKGSRVVGLTVQRAPVPRCACDCLPVAMGAEARPSPGQHSCILLLQTIMRLNRNENIQPKWLVVIERWPGPEGLGLLLLLLVGVAYSARQHKLTPQQNEHGPESERIWRLMVGRARVVLSWVVLHYGMVWSLNPAAPLVSQPSGAASPPPCQRSQGVCETLAVTNVKSKYINHNSSNRIIKVSFLFSFLFCIFYTGEKVRKTVCICICMQDKFKRKR